LRRVIVRPEAAYDIRSARDWYLQQDASAEADRLLDEIGTALSKLEKYAHSFRVEQVTDGGVQIRKVGLRRFPYVMIYVIEPNDTIQIIALTHVRRSNFWLTRLG